MWTHRSCSQPHNINTLKEDRFVGKNYSIGIFLKISEQFFRMKKRTTNEHSILQDFFKNKIGA